MRITRIDISGFGVLRSFRAELGPRLNLFTGDNEAGKSTLQQAILALLYGFYPRGRVTQADRDMHERYRPWTEGAYGGILEYMLNSGQRFRIQRSFETDDLHTSIFDLDTGRDLAQELGLGRHGNVPLGTEHLGMRREVFLSTCFVDRTSIARIDQPEAVSEAVVSMADTATTDSSVEEAVRRLDAAITQIGTVRASRKPLPMVRDRLQRARTEQARLEADYLSLQRSAAEKDECEERLRQLRAEQRRVSYCIVVRRLQEVNDRLSALEIVDLTLADLERRREALTEFASFPTEIRDTVLAEKGRLDILLEQRAHLEASWPDLPDEIEAVQREMQECRRDVESMEYARNFPVEREEEFHRLRFSLESSRKRLSEARRDAEARELHDEGLNSALLPVGTLASGLALALVAGLWLALAGNPAFGLILSALIAAGTLALAYLRFYLSSLHKDQRPGAMPGGLRNEEEQAEGASKMLMELLGAVGIRADNLDSGVEAFQKRMVSARGLLKREAELAAMEEKLQRLVAARQQIEDGENQVNVAERTLLRTLRRAGIDGPDPAKNVDLFQGRYDGRITLDQTQAKLLNKREQKQALLGSRTEAMLAAERDSLQAEATAILAAAPEVSGATTERGFSELEEEVSSLGRQMAEIQERKTRLETVMQTVLSKHRPRAEIEEDIACFESEAARLARYSAALTLAKDTLKEASEEVHRDFAPRLAESLGKGLHRITQGRYEFVFVDPKDFAIRLQSADSGKIVHVGHLSTGTREQAYLLLRIELARMLSSNRESLPLIMDDPFVNFDDKRLRRVMELLLEISSEHQVLLFTKDVSAVELLKSGCGDTDAFTVHNLQLSS